MEQERKALLTVGDADFERVVLDSARPAVVDFTAAWCGPCRAVAPVIEGLASDYADRVTVAKVDIVSPVYVPKANIFTRMIRKTGLNI